MPTEKEMKTKVCVKTLMIFEVRDERGRIRHIAANRGPDGNAPTCLGRQCAHWAPSDDMAEVVMQEPGQEPKTILVGRYDPLFEKGTPIPCGACGLNYMIRSPNG